MKKLTQEQAEILNYSIGSRGHVKTPLRLNVESLQVGDIVLFKVGEDMTSIQKLYSVVYAINEKNKGAYSLRTLADKSGAVVTRNW